FAKARFTHILLPLARKLLTSEQAQHVSISGYLEFLDAPHSVPMERDEEYCASYIAGRLGDLRFGGQEAHGRAAIADLSFLMENRALRFESGRFAIDYAGMRAAVAALAIQSRDSLHSKYTTIPAEWKAALATAADVPVDIRPIFPFPEERP